MSQAKHKTIPKHPRFKKEVAGSRHKPYGKTSDYVSYVQAADDLQIGGLIKIHAMLSTSFGVATARATADNRCFDVLREGEGLIVYSVGRCGLKCWVAAALFGVDNEADGYQGCGCYGSDDWQGWGWFSRDGCALRRLVAA
jgi:hypothetical protein